MDTSDWLPPVIAVGSTAILIVVLRLLISRRRRGSPETALRLQAWTLGLVLAGLVAMLFTLPEGSNQELLLGVLGLIVTASIALSSQSIISNGMAGLMLRVVSDFRPGDFIEVGDHMGRVSEMTLLHTEIQTPDRDLLTVPNSLMMTQPVKVVRASGTIVSATVSLGYDVSHHWLEPLFVAAADEAGLEEGFVQVLDLGNYSVTYRVAGFLPDPSQLITSRSRLRIAILDTLHAADIEIVSPLIVGRRTLNDEALLPDPGTGSRRGPKRRSAEDRVFDKAELAAGVDKLKARAKEIGAELERFREEARDADDGERDGHDRRIEIEERRLQVVENRVEHLKALLDGNGTG